MSEAGRADERACPGGQGEGDRDARSEAKSHRCEDGPAACNLDSWPRIEGVTVTLA